MATDTAAVVFVGLSDLARVTGKTRQRFSQLLADHGKPGSVLPSSDALINQSPAWILDTVVASLRSAGYSIDSRAVEELRAERTVPHGTVPVGAYEAAEVLGGIPLSTLHSRNQDKAISRPIFVMARKMVWDMDDLLLDARTRGFAVDDEAAAKWRERNGGAGQTPWRQVEVVVSIEAYALASDDEAAAQLATDHVRHVLAASDARSAGRVRVAKVAARSAQR